MSVPKPSTAAVATPSLPMSVLELQRAGHDLATSVQPFLGRKMVIPKAKDVAQKLVASSTRIIDAIVAACRMRPGEPSVLAKPFIAVIHEHVMTFDEWTTFIRGRATASAIKNMATMLGTFSQLNSYLAAMQVFEEMLLARQARHCEAHVGSSSSSQSDAAKADLDLFVLFSPPKLSSFKATYHGFNIALQGMVNMTEGALWPWKAIPQTILQFMNLVKSSLEQSGRIQELVKRMSRRIIFLLEVSENNGKDDAALCNSVEIFFADVQGIMIRLRFIQKLHPAKSLPLAQQIEKILDGETEKMQIAFEELQARFTVHTAYAVQGISEAISAVQITTAETLSTTSKTRKDVKVVSHIVASTAVTVETIQMTTEVTHAAVAEIRDDVKKLGQAGKPNITNRARLPGGPSVFNGREEQMKEIIRLVCENFGARIIILGPGGIGKTSLANAILHDDEVVSIVEDNRFFVSVEDLIDVESAAQPISALSALPRSLLVIDNLETLWLGNNAAAQVDTQRMLERLADIPSLTLIVTSRGSVPPSGINWSNVQSAELEAISLDAARDTFVQIAGRPQLTAECAALDELIISVDCVPLAVTLLARLGQQKNSPSRLLQRWHQTKTRFIRTHGNHRETSVDISIQISLDLLAAMSGGDEGGQLLSICAHLPDGLRPPVFAQLCDQFSDIDAARDLLVTFALVSVGTDNELKMLSPVRHFIVDNRPMTTGHAVALRRIYFKIAPSDIVMMDENFSRLAQNLAPEYTNLTSFLLYLIGAEEPSEELFKVVSAVSSYAYYNSPSTTLYDALRVRLTARHAWLAECLLILGIMHLYRNEDTLALEHLQTACGLYDELDNRSSTLYCTYFIAECLCKAGRYEEAERETLAARDTCIKSGDESGAARLTIELGDIYQQQGIHDQAVAYITSARDILQRCGQRMEVAKCSQNLASVLIEQGNYASADTELQYAISEFEKLGDQLSAAHFNLLLGDIRIKQKDYHGAETLFKTAQEAFVRFGDRSSLAYCHMSFGDLYHEQDRLSEALVHYEISRNIFEAMELQKPATVCNDVIAKLQTLLAVMATIAPAESE
ncbi:hypothetical protein BKA62DRAFT_771068 [Auriculariales sp. MPI-PUGE-AT-0066]|nr:hypothetical protein BKA62DRAFT_771068 [Auriculariales sp. MPI-PUGE-AT-0066]